MSFKQESKRGLQVAALTETALLIAIAYALSFIQPLKMPLGGAVTPFSMLPVMLAGIRNGKTYGLIGAFAYGGLQMLQGLWPTPANTALSFAVMIMLDYVLAFGVLGVSSFFPRTNKGFLTAVPVCAGLRFLCHYVSGLVIWGSAIEGMPAALYSLLYNGAYMLADTAICMAVALVLVRSKVLFYGLDKRRVRI